jgi:GAF domain-containing protein
MKIEALKPQLTEVINQKGLFIKEKMQTVCDLLQLHISTYDWVGFYMAHETAPTLHLWNQAGEPTDHTVIPFGRGICGQVAISNSNFVVADVQAQDNYIACSIHVKSEIVIPMFKKGKNIGQIDIDSNTINAFNDEDERFLEWLNELIAQYL